MNRKQAAGMADIDVTRPRLSLASEFNNFLYQRIGADGWDTQLSIVSVLARLDLDPWVEAERLSRLPDESAIGSLSAIVSRIPEITLGTAARQQTAMRLVQLLPKRFPGKPATSTIRRAAYRQLLPWIIITFLLCVFPLLQAGQFFWHTYYGASSGAVNAIAAPRIPTPPSKIGE